jgi:hypothetical protein
MIEAEQSMKTLNMFRNVINDFIWVIGVFAIINYVDKQWPLAYTAVSNALLVGFGVWYVWRFFIQPFREGLR